MKTINPDDQELIDNRRPGGDSFPPELAHLKALAMLMDNLIEVPGLRVKAGLDALLGLIPGLGDLISSLISLYIIQAASQQGVPRVTMARMGANVLIDMALGAVPFVGDIFDIYYKANEKNLLLLQQHVQSTPKEARRRQWGDGLFLAGIVLGVLAVLVMLMTVAYLLAMWIQSLVFPARA